MKRIGVDIDDVMTTTSAVYLDRVEKMLNRKFNREDLTEYLFEDSLDLSLAEVERVWQVLLQDDIWENMPTLEGMQPTVERLQKKYPLFIVTSRPILLKEKTEKWLANMKINYDKLIFTDMTTKLKYITEENISLTHFIEDRWDFAWELAAGGIEVLLFDQPWNRKQAVCPGMRRVQNWQEIEKLLL